MKAVQKPLDMFKRFFTWVRRVHQVFRLQAILADLLLLAIVWFASIGRLPIQTELLMEIFLTTVFLHVVASIISNGEVVRLVTENVAGEIQKQHVILASCETCGLVKIVPNRSEVADEVRHAIENARSDIALMGVTLHERINLSNLFDLLRKKVAEGVNVRVLLLDPVRSAAVFRTLVETAPTQMRDAIDFKPTKGHKKHLYFDLPLYERFKVSFTKIDHGPNELKDRIRYYGNEPTCWMVIADDVVYYQPYAFSRVHRQKEANEEAYDPMPVFVFRRNVITGKQVYTNLKEHFEVVWLTCLVDHWQMVSRKETAQEIVVRMFDERRYWLDHMLLALSGEERRKSPRQPGAAGDRIVVATWTHSDGRREKAKAAVIDYGSDALTLQLDGTVPHPGAEIRLDVLNDSLSDDVRSRLAATFISQFVERTQNHLTVLRAADDTRVCVCVPQKAQSSEAASATKETTASAQTTTESGRPQQQ